MQALDQRQAEPQKCQGRGHHYTQRVQAVLEQDEDAKRHDDPVHERRHRVERVDQTFVGLTHHRHRATHPQHMLLEQIDGVLLGTLIQIGHAQKIREDKVSVETQQRIDVKQNRDH